MSYRDPITVSGSLVTFNDPDGDGRITNLSAAISPIQDLNGYDHPWPGGAGKNLLPNLKYQYATNRVVIGQEVPYTNTTLTLESAEYTLTIKLANAISLPYVYLRHNEADTRLGYIASGLQKSFTFTAEAGTYSFSIYRTSGVSVDDIEWFMLESGSTATAYEPYENICPISGLTGLSVYRTGVNVWDEQYFISSSRIQSNYIPVLPNTTYNRVSPNNIFPLYYDADKTQLSTGVWGTGAFTTPANCYYLRFQVDPVYGETYNHDISINYPSTDTSYHAYQGNLYSVDWSTQAGTVYHGTVDPVAGQLTVDWVMYTFDGSEAWTASATPHRFSTNINYLPHPIATQPMTQGATQNVLTSVFGECVYTNADGVGYIVQQSSISLFVVNESAATTVDDIKAIVTGMQFCYELATPITYQLTRQEVEALLGTNNIWADAGDVTVTYQLARHGFEGWLIKVGTEQTEIPLNFIRYSTYKVTPDQRMEWSAERNVNGVLQRETVPNMPPKIEFNTKLLTNSDVTALMSILNKSFTVASERKLPVYFYDPENNTYKTWDCYMPDIDFKIRNVDTVKNIINYEELRFAFIGY